MTIKCRIKPEVHRHFHAKLGDMAAGSEVYWDEEWGPVPEQVLEEILSSPPVGEGLGARANEEGGGD